MPSEAKSGLLRKELKLQEGWRDSKSRAQANVVPSTVLQD